MKKYKLKFLLFLLIQNILISNYINPQRKNAEINLKDDRMVLIPSGYYSPFYKVENNPEKIRVNSFYLDKFPVTNKEFLEFVLQNPNWRKSKVIKIFADDTYLKDWKGDLEIGLKALPDGPVTNVSWFSANEYAKWKGKRLPTIAEWEYAASAGANNSVGNKEKNISKKILVWYSKPVTGKISVVGKGRPNYFGVYDMFGLTWEWVDDFNSILIINGSDRNLFCGGGSERSVNPSDYIKFMRYAFRSSLKANYCISSLGFRCAKDIVDYKLSGK